MAKSDIEWTDDTWNPTRGCKVKSAGCANCYAMRMAGRFSKPGKPFEGLVTIGKNKRAIWNGEARLVPHMLAIPLSWKKPRRVFVNSMSDLFYEGFTNEEIAAVYGVMAACPHITFQVLTKRAERLPDWYEWVRTQTVGGQLRRPGSVCVEHADNQLPEEWRHRFRCGHWRNTPIQWPLRNVWLGVSVENQDAANERIPFLLDTPAAIRFLSCEPLLGPLNLDEYFDPCSVPCGEEPWPDLDWLIAGCESGPGARHADPQWFRDLRDLCAREGVPFFLKQGKPGDGIASTYSVAGNEVASLPELDGVVHNAFPPEPPDPDRWDPPGDPSEWDAQP